MDQLMVDMGDDGDVANVHSLNKLMGRRPDFRWRPIVRRLRAAGYNNLVTRTRAELDLTDVVEAIRLLVLE